MKLFILDAFNFSNAEKNSKFRVLDLPIRRDILLSNRLSGFEIFGVLGEYALKIIK